ncbi:MAG: methyl-accepting chemotaxis protein [Bradyrhizobium sp.]|jgi:methyl-accepting chemotaxis protein|nr:methyl-accepting chemotaxis protein [Bradyrhizobium sp.]
MSFSHLAKLRIGTKIYAVVGLLSVVSIVIAVLALLALTNYNSRVAEMQNASQRSFIGEQINSLVYAVVMDSRGVYMARDAAEAEKFGKPMQKNLQEIKNLITAWRELLPAQRKLETDRASANIDKFIQFRTEMVRRGIADGAAAARELGDNDENRANRQNLNKEVEVLARSTSAEITNLKNELDGFYHSKMIQLIALTVIGVAVSVSLSMLTVVRFIARPIAALTRVMGQLASGASNILVPGTEGDDEVGEMSRAVLVFQKSMEREQGFQETRRAEEQEKDRRRASLEALIRSFGDEIEKVVRAVGGSAKEVKATAERLSTTVEETAAQTTKVANAADEASGNVQTVAAAAEELHASIDEISRQVTRSAEIAKKAVDETAATDTSVSALSNAGQKIGEVVQLIQNIASQTNLLALNATIEAARAGEAGRGFAVVASEVKSLATQTARATEEIAEQVSTIQNATEAVVGAFRNTGTTITEMNEIAAAISSAIVEQGAATREIAGNINQAAAGTDEVSNNIASVREATNGNGESATQMLATAVTLSSQAETLRSRVDEFVVAVRAA